MMDAPFLILRLIMAFKFNVRTDLHCCSQLKMLLGLACLFTDCVFLLLRTNRIWDNAWKPINLYMYINHNKCSYVEELCHCRF